MDDLHIQLPILSSPDFLQLAALAKRLNFQVEKFLMVDRSYSSLSEIEQNEVSEDLIAALYESGSYGVQLRMSQDYSDYFFNGIDLSANQGRHLNIQGDGLLVSNSQSLVDGLFWEASKTPELKWLSDLANTALEGTKD